MTTPPRFELPSPVGKLLSHLPAYPGSVLLVSALNLTLANKLPADVTSHLLHKTLCIHIRDAQLRFDFAWSGQRFTACNRQDPADLTIRASAQDFVQLAQRQVDPDTLFFSRRLVMEGDTELGLIVKNALDALELPVLDAAHWAPRQVLSRLAALRPGARP